MSMMMNTLAANVNVNEALLRRPRFGCQRDDRAVKVVDEVSHHLGNVWALIVSLQREDAARL